MIDVLSYSIEYSESRDYFWTTKNYTVRFSFKHSSENIQTLIDAGYTGSLECLDSNSEIIIIPIIITASESFTSDDISEIIQYPTMALIHSRNPDSGLRNFSNLLLKTFETSNAFEITLEEPEISTSQD